MTKYDQLLFLGDFNAGVEDSSIKDFCSSFKLTSMINKPTCFKNLEKLCIDLILTNCPRSFQNSCVIETGLSDFHKLVVTVVKTTYKKSQPKIITYRDYKYFNNDGFREALLQIESNGNNCDENFRNFTSSCNIILNKQAPQKKKFVRGNQSPFMNKDLSKAIMKRTKLRNIFLKNRIEENRNHYTKQRNVCVTLLRKSKREFYGSLNVKNLCDNKKFWSVVKPVLSNKVMSSEKITLVENDDILENDKRTATVFNNLFSNNITNLGIPQYIEEEPISQNIDDPLMKAIVKYRNHPSIVAIKGKCDSVLSFSFSQVERDEIMKEINNLKKSKAIQSTDILTKLIKENCDIFCDFTFENFNSYVLTSIYPNPLKNADITPVFKKGTKTSKDNYRPVSILSNISKIHERLMFKQISEYFEPILSKFQCGFRKGFSVQHCLLAMLEKWKAAVDNKKTFGALLTDLSKAFDCFPHDLLLAKLKAYGFSLSALKLVQSYLSNRKQRTKINLEFSSWEEILFGVPQESILGPLLFNIFLCDSFIIMNDVDFASYADDNTPFFVANDLDEVIYKLQNASKSLFQWFADNQMKAKPDKCHFICSANVKTSIMIENEQIENSNCEKLLGVFFDSRLTFQTYINNICKKASQKLNAISRITPYMDFDKRKLVVNAFFSSQFN